MWTGETSASIDIRAPAALLFTAYADIEQMPRWAPMLESVVLVDAEARRSEWALRVPRPVLRIVRAAGFNNLVRWEATHDVDPPRELRWRSLSGVQNAGVARFEASSADARATTVTLTMTYTLPDLAGPIAQSAIAQSFVRRTMLSTFDRFKEELEAKAAALEADVAGIEEGGVVVPQAREATDAGG